MRSRLVAPLLLLAGLCNACKPADPPVPTSTTRVLASDERGMWVARAGKQPGAEDVLYCVKPAKPGERPRCWPAKIEKGQKPSVPAAASTPSVACTAVPCTAVPCTAVPCTTSSVGAVGGGGAFGLPASRLIGGGHDRTLPPELAKTFKQTGPSSWTLQRKALEVVFANTSLIGRSARIVPSIRDGRPHGFKLYAIRPGSFYWLLGLKNGDTVHAINGFALSSPSAALTAYAKVRKARKVTLTLTRRGQPLTFRYTVR